MHVDLDQLIAYLNALRDYHGGHTPVAVRILTPWEEVAYLDVHVNPGVVASTLKAELVTREPFNG